MAEKFQNKYRVPSARAAWWDYSQPGAYFVTICTHDRSHSFGEIIGRDVACNVSTPNMELLPIGEYAKKYWYEIPDHFPHVQLGAFQIMPNHIHGIIIICDTVVETMHASSLREPTADYKFMASISPKSGSLARIIGSYKSAVSKSAHLINPSFEWQERYHDHIIRDEDEYNRIQEYIVNNPKNWVEDRFYNDNQPKNDDDFDGREDARRDDACIVSTPQLPLPPTNKYWLVKFAPFRYSWEDILRNGRFEIYSVRNPQARNNLKSMQLGDEVLFYHSQQGNCIMGKMKVIEEAHQDKTTTDPRWVSVTFEPVETFQNPISLATIKTTEGLEKIGLVIQPRLAVMPVSNIEYEILINDLKSME